MNDISGFYRKDLNVMVLRATGSLTSTGTATTFVLSKDEAEKICNVIKTSLNGSTPEETPKNPLVHIPSRRGRPKKKLH